MYDEAIWLDPNYADAWRGKGVVLKALDKTTETNIAFAKAKLQAHGSHVAGYFVIVYMIIEDNILFLYTMIIYHSC